MRRLELNPAPLVLLAFPEGFIPAHMSHNLNSLGRGGIGDDVGEYYRIYWRGY